MKGEQTESAANAAIIVAAGLGTRMGKTVRKQYLLIQGRPVLGHTLHLFASCPLIDTICLVVPEEDFHFCRNNIVNPLGINKAVMLVPGGQERQHSVYNGIFALDDDTDIVVVHDGVRPFVLEDQLSACMDIAWQMGACILGIPVYDTVKQISASSYIDKTIDRNGLWLAQTPQAFQFSLLKAAHVRAREENYSGTDDASLIEWMGGKVKIIKGSRYNIKITSPEDYELARKMMSRKHSEQCYTPEIL